MNKTWIVLGVIAAIGICIWLCPCRKGMPGMKCLSPGMESKDKTCCKTHGRGPMGHKGGHGMKDDMDKEVLLAPDGGLFVVAGNQITKFDKDLNVVKEVEMNDDMGMMGQENMGMMHGDKMGMMSGDKKGMKKVCPMMGGAVQAADKAEGAAKAAPASVKK